MTDQNKTYLALLITLVVIGVLLLALLATLLALWMKNRPPELEGNDASVQIQNLNYTTSTILQQVNTLMETGQGSDVGNLEAIVAEIRVLIAAQKADSVARNTHMAGVLQALNILRHDVEELQAVVRHGRETTRGMLSAQIGELGGDLGNALGWIQRSLDRMRDAPVGAAASSGMSGDITMMRGMDGLGGAVGGIGPMGHAPVGAAELFGMSGDITMMQGMVTLLSGEIGEMRRELSGMQQGGSGEGSSPTILEVLAGIQDSLSTMDQRISAVSGIMDRSGSTHYGLSAPMSQASSRDSLSLILGDARDLATSPGPLRRESFSAVSSPRTGRPATAPPPPLPPPPPPLPPPPPPVLTMKRSAQASSAQAESGGGGHGEMLAEMLQAQKRMSAKREERAKEGGGAESPEGGSKKKKIVLTLPLPLNPNAAMLAAAMARRRSATAFSLTEGFFPSASDWEEPSTTQQGADAPPEPGPESEPQPLRADSPDSPSGSVTSSRVKPAVAPKPSRKK